MNKLQKIIFFLFGILFFATPLIFWPFTSEVFELNKIVFVYAVATLIAAAWLARTVLARKIIFRRTLLDIPLLIFVTSQILSTIFSIDPRTSFFGYYSRFNGGLLSTISYSLLYWAYVSNIDSKQVAKHIYILLASSFIAAVAAVLEHFGIFLTCGTIGKITENCWIQDVQLRVFSTFGQPNWLATWVVALIPMGWALALEYKSVRAGVLKLILLHSFTLLFFITLLFTGSRSGLLGFAVAYLIFWGITFRKYKKEALKPFAIIGSSLLVISLLFGTPWTPSIFKSNSKPLTTPVGPALETGGTESGTIRKIVWKGAVEVWKHYPIVGSGLETFAYSYYGSRPVEHNLVSEWDFIYNKAHNEYLNFAANSGTLGLLSYLLLIGFSIYQIVKISNKYQYPINTNVQSKTLEIWNLKLVLIGIISGYSSLLVTNFFGFSVVTTQLLFFLMPAFASVLAVQSTQYTEIAPLRGQSKKLNSLQMFAIFLLLSTTYFVLSTIFKFWLADINFTKGKIYSGKGNYIDGIKYLTLAINSSPNEPLYHNEIAQSYTLAGVDAKTNGKADDLQKYTELALAETMKAVTLSPANVNLRRTQFGVYIRLAVISPQFLAMASKTLEDAVKLAPTDAKIIYNLGLTQARLGEATSALENVSRAVILKPNYRDARLARALLLIDKKEFEKARAELNYILTNIDPNDTTTKQTLEEIGSQ